MLSERREESEVYKIDVMIRVLIGIMLLLCGLSDIKTKHIPIKITILCIILLFILMPFQRNISIINSLLGAFVGVVMIGISKVSRGQVGIGDGIILTITGFGIGLWNNLTLLIYALFCISIVAMILLALKKISRKKTLPFVPFLFIGYIGVLFA